MDPPVLSKLPPDLGTGPGLGPQPRQTGARSVVRREQRVLSLDRAQYINYLSIHYTRLGHGVYGHGLPGQGGVPLVV